MPVVRLLWWVVSAPFRLFYWFAWQCRRAGYAAVHWLQRRIGQRNTLILFGVLLAAFGVGLLTGAIDCGRRCVPGWEWAYGVVFAGFGAFVAWIAVTKVPNLREPGLPMEHDFLEYRREDWKLSWGPVLTILAIVVIVAGGALLLRLTGVF